MREERERESRRTGLRPCIRRGELPEQALLAWDIVRRERERV